MDETLENKRIIQIRVTNKNKVGGSDGKGTFIDGHEGKTYVFEGEGKTTVIPLKAAKHIFGYDVRGSDEKKMFDHVCKRWGFNTYDNVKNRFADVIPLWANFNFVPVSYVLKEQAQIDTSALAEDRVSAAGQGTPEKNDLKLGQPSVKVA